MDKGRTLPSPAFVRVSILAVSAPLFAVFCLDHRFSVTSAAFLRIITVQGRR